VDFGFGIADWGVRIADSARFFITYHDLTAKDAKSAKSSQVFSASFAERLFAVR
jgi:hypothetical protein